MKNYKKGLVITGLITSLTAFGLSGCSSKTKSEVIEKSGLIEERNPSDATFERLVYRGIHSDGKLVEIYDKIIANNDSEKLLERITKVYNKSKIENLVAGDSGGVYFVDYNRDGINFIKTSDDRDEIWLFFGNFRWIKYSKDLIKNENYLDDEEFIAPFSKYTDNIQKAKIELYLNKRAELVDLYNKVISEAARNKIGFNNK